MLRLKKSLGIRRKGKRRNSQSAHVGEIHAGGAGEGLRDDACLQVSQRLAATYPASTTPTRTQVGRGGTGGELTVLEGAAMVSISSWVTHTLPDGYRAGGAGPKRQSSGVW